jgi:hypothetical protein
MIEQATMIKNQQSKNDDEGDSHSSSDSEHEVLKKIIKV